MQFKSIKIGERPLKNTLACHADPAQNGKKFEDVKYNFNV
jgi:hypothetical protein